MCPVCSDVRPYPVWICFILCVQFILWVHCRPYTGSGWPLLLYICTFVCVRFVSTAPRVIRESACSLNTILFVSGFLCLRVVLYTFGLFCQKPVLDVYLGFYVSRHCMLCVWIFILVCSAVWVYTSFSSLAIPYALPVVLLPASIRRVSCLFHWQGIPSVYQTFYISRHCTLCADFVLSDTLCVSGLFC